MKFPARTDDLEVPSNFESDELQIVYVYAASRTSSIGVEARQGVFQPADPRRRRRAVRLDAEQQDASGCSTAPSTKLYVTNQSDAPTDADDRQSQTDVPLVEVRQIPIAAAAVVGDLSRLPADPLAAARHFDDRAGHVEGSRRPAALFARAAASAASCCCLYIYHSVQHVRRRREDVQGLGPDDDHGAGDPRRRCGRRAFRSPTKSKAAPRSRCSRSRSAAAQFVLGKFLGIVWANFLMFVILGAWMLILVSYKVVYDARETSNPEPTWQLCSAEMIGIVPGLVLAFMETVVLAAISVAISTRLPMLPNLVICGSIYVLGHLGPLIVQSSVGQNEFVAFFGQLIALDRCRCSTTSTSRRPSPAACPCRPIISPGPRCTACSTRPSRCCWR